MTTSKSYDNLNRLTSTSSSNATPAVLDSHGYAYNNANQRTSVTNTDGTYWIYQYDNLGQVISGVKYWSDNSVVAGQQFGYNFDTIGNRTSAQAGGDQNGANLRSATYTANNLNQYSSRTVPAYLNVLGTANSNATVSLNITPTYRKGTYYRDELAVTNASGPVYLSVTNLAVLNNGTNADIVTNVIGNIFLPQTPENFSYDADGNLTQDGRWTYTWDGENRLLNMTSLSGGPSASKLKLDFAYDYQGRRIQKLVSTWNGSAYVAASTNRFAYDGWNLSAILNPDSSVQTSFVWGLDLIGSLQGSGGVGGLLKISSQGTNVFVCFDGNGNMMAMIDASSSAVIGQYEYGPFGEVTRATGLMVKLNPFRFSTKYQDNESNFDYYGRRYLSASTGKWLSKDPIDEKGGYNLYGFVANSPVIFWDINGLDFATWCGAGACYGNWGPVTSSGCNLSYAFDNDDAWWEKFSYPGGTKWVQTMAQVKADIAQKRKTCCCIQSIYFSQHNGVPGALMVGEGMITPSVLQMIQNETDEARKQVEENSIRHEKEFLQMVSKYMCKGGKVIFVQCESGTGPEGQDLQNWLNGIFGPSTTVTLFAGNVRWVYGTPHCTQH